MSIEQVYRAGEDALQNVWEIAFLSEGELDNVIAFSESAKFRTKSVNIPELVLPTYVVHHNNIAYEKISTKLDTVKDLTFNLRLNKYFAIYESLIKWRNAIHDFSEQSNVADTLDKKIRIDVAIQPTPKKVFYNNGGKQITSDVQTIKWIFKNCFPKKIGEIGFDYTGGEAIDIEVTLGFLRMQEIIP